MPLYLDVHTSSGAAADDVARAHPAGLRALRRCGVRYLRHRVGEQPGQAQKEGRT